MHDFKSPKFTCPGPEAISHYPELRSLSTFLPTVPLISKQSEV